MEFINNGLPDDDRNALDDLVKRHAKPGMVAFELGSYTGCSSITILKHVEAMNGKLYCVDWFRGQPGWPDLVTQSYAKHNILDIFLKNIQEGGFQNHVVPIVGQASDAAAIVADQCADFIFIDADHRYEGVRKDIIHWISKLKGSGILCGHDYNELAKSVSFFRLLEKSHQSMGDVILKNPATGKFDFCPVHFGVMRAVTEFFTNEEHRAAIWFTTKEDRSPALQFAVDLRAKENLCRWSDIMTGSIEIPIYDSRTYVSFATSLSAEGLQDVAVHLLSNLLSAMSDDPILLSALSLQALEKGEYEKGIDYLYRLAQLTPDDPFVLNKLGEAAFQAGRYDEAELAFGKSMQSCPCNVDTISNLAVLFHKKKQMEKAVEYISEAFRICSPIWIRYSEVIFNYAWIMNEIGQTSEAINIMNELIRFFPSEERYQDVRRMMRGSISATTGGSQQRG
jgi:Tfp pilus assembly protein PilF